MVKRAQQGLVNLFEGTEANLDVLDGEFDIPTTSKTSTNNVTTALTPAAVQRSPGKKHKLNKMNTPGSASQVDIIAP